MTCFYLGAVEKDETLTIFKIIFLTFSSLTSGCQYFALSSSCISWTSFQLMVRLFNQCVYFCTAQSWPMTAIFYGIIYSDILWQGSGRKRKKKFKWFDLYISFLTLWSFALVSIVIQNLVALLTLNFCSFYLKAPEDKVVEAEMRKEKGKNPLDFLRSLILSEANFCIERPILLPPSSSSYYFHFRRYVRK